MIKFLTKSQETRLALSKQVYGENQVQYLQTVNEVNIIREQIDELAIEKHTVPGYGI